MDTNRFRETFKEEAFDNIDTIESSLLEIEKGTARGAVDEIFRAMHSLKGGASMFSFPHIHSLAHHLENIYEKFRDQKQHPDDNLISVTFQACDIIKSLLDQNDTPAEQESYEAFLNHLESLTDPKPADSEVAKQESKAGVKTYFIRFVPGQEIIKNGINPIYLLDDLMNLGAGYSLLRTDKIPPLPDADPELCYIYWDILVATKSNEEEIKEVFLFVEDESDISISLVAETDLLSVREVKDILHQLSENAEIPVKKIQSYAVAKSSSESTGFSASKPAETDPLQSIKVSSGKIDELMNTVGEMVTFGSRLTALAYEKESSELDELQESMVKLTSRLREIAFDITLVPLSTMLLRFRRLVRDLSKEQGKDIEFRTEGTETQLDKTIIEHLYEPVLHILRNSISHGIETPQERKKAGKNPQAQILLKAYYDGPEVVIEIGDDGKGFDLDKIKSRATDKGWVKKGAGLSEEEWLNLTFEPGFTTTHEIDGVSGRGVGMDVIKSKLAEIKGDAKIQSKQGKGATMILSIPLTLSILEGLTVKCDDLNLVIPVSAVIKIDSVPREKLLRHNRFMALNNESIPLAPLFFEPDAEHPDKEYPVVIVQNENRKYGLVVQNLLGNSQVVLKSLGNYLKNTDVFSGGCVLGDGSIGYVLDIKRFVNAASRKGNIKDKHDGTKS